MARYGPIVTSTGSLALGLAQIRVGASATNIADIQPALTSTDSLGAMANTKFMGNTDFFKFESGYPLLEDITTVTRETAALECAFHEISPQNMAYAYGIDATTGYDTATSGEVPLGNRGVPVYLRMEALYTFPNKSNTMTIIFPRAQITSSNELDLQSESATAVTIVFEAKTASSDQTDGDAVWNDKPLGRIAWA